MSAVSSPATKRSGHDLRAHRDPGLARTLGQRARDQGVNGAGRRDDDLLRADRTRREQRPVDDEVGSVGKQRFVLARGRLALGAVRDDHRPRPPVEHRLEFRGGREACPAAASQP